MPFTGKMLLQSAAEDPARKIAKSKGRYFAEMQTFDGNLHTAIL